MLLAGKTAAISGAASARGIGLATARLFAKHDAARLLARELAAPGYRPATIALGTATDPYQPIEREYGLTRAVLEVLAEARHPVAITTKSDLVLRDLDILPRFIAPNDVLTSWDLGVGKPDARAFREAVRRVGLPDLRPDEVLHVGDDPDECARCSAAPFALAHTQSAQGLRRRPRRRPRGRPRRRPRQHARRGAPLFRAARAAAARSPT